MAAMHTVLSTTKEAWSVLGVGALRLVYSETPMQHFVICAANALWRPTLHSVLGSAPFGERVRRELSEHSHP